MLQLCTNAKTLVSCYVRMHSFSANQKRVIFLKCTLLQDKNDRLNNIIYCLWEFGFVLEKNGVKPKEFSLTVQTVTFLKSSSFSSLLQNSEEQWNIQPTPICCYH